MIKFRYSSRTILLLIIFHGLFCFLLWLPQTKLSIPHFIKEILDTLLCPLECLSGLFLEPLKWCLSLSHLLPDFQSIFFDLSFIEYSYLAHICSILLHWVSRISLYMYDIKEQFIK